MIMTTLQHLGARLGARLGLASVALLVLTMLSIALASGGAHAQAPQDSDLTGRYRGQQDGSSFVMSLDQDGFVLRGQIQEGDRLDPDRITGTTNGLYVAFIRHAAPAEFWIGTATDGALAGRWFSTGGGVVNDGGVNDGGAWTAERIVSSETVLRVEKSVRPETIPAGSASRVTYTVIVANRNDVAAQDVRLRDTDLPPFYTIESVSLLRFNSETESVVSGDAIDDADGIAIGTLPPGAAVQVIIRGLAEPRDAGRFVNVAVASASNALRASDSAVLHVVAPDVRVSASFVPPVIREGRDGRVTYALTVSGRIVANTPVVISNATLEGLLQNATVTVRGGSASGSLATGLVITPNPDSPLATPRIQVTVTGTAGHLTEGRYETVSLINVAGGAVEERVARTLTVIAGPDRPADADGEIDRDRNSDDTPRDDARERDAGDANTDAGAGADNQTAI